MTLNHFKLLVSVTHSIFCYLVLISLIWRYFFFFHSEFSLSNIFCFCFDISVCLYVFNIFVTTNDNMTSKWSSFRFWWRNMCILFYFWLMRFILMISKNVWNCPFKFLWFGYDSNKMLFMKELNPQSWGDELSILWNSNDILHLRSSIDIIESQLLRFAHIHSLINSLSRIHTYKHTHRLRHSDTHASSNYEKTTIRLIITMMIMILIMMMTMSTPANNK